VAPNTKNQAPVGGTPREHPAVEHPAGGVRIPCTGKPDRQNGYLARKLVMVHTPCKLPNPHVHFVYAICILCILLTPLYTLCTHCAYCANIYTQYTLVRTGSHIVYTLCKKYAQSLIKVCSVRSSCAQFVEGILLENSLDELCTPVHTKYTLLAFCMHTLYVLCTL